MVSVDLVGGATARKKGTSDNCKNIWLDHFEAWVLNTRHHHLMDPALLKEFCDAFTREMNRLRVVGCASIAAAEAEITRIDRELDILLSDSDGRAHRQLSQVAVSRACIGQKII